MYVSSPSEEGQGPLRFLFVHMALPLLNCVRARVLVFQGCASEDETESEHGAQSVRNCQWPARYLGPVPAARLYRTAWPKRRQCSESALDEVQRELGVRALVWQPVARDDDVLAEVARTLAGRVRRLCEFLPYAALQAPRMF